MQRYRTVMTGAYLTAASRAFTLLVMCRFLSSAFFVVALACPATAQPSKAPRAENIIIVTLDGFRWQELFGGADESLLNKEAGGVRDALDLKKRFWRPSAQERRVALMPFFWSTIAKEGQIFGDQSRQAPARATNGLKFSYPGYSEMFCGFADPAIDSNAQKNNPNMTVLEFLNKKPAYRGKVAVFATWDVFPFIFRSERSGIKVHDAWRPVTDPPLTSRQRFMNELIPSMPRYWTDVSFDMVSMEFAREHLRRHKPRVLFIGLGETDEWGHARRYDLYLGAAHGSDRYIGELWRELQTMPEYKGKTALLITTDHGRGATRADWTDHGAKVPLAEYVWIAVLGADAPALGVRANVETTQSQIAATIAHLVGEDWRAASPKAAGPLPGVR